MSERARIGYVNGLGEITSVYCHNSGQPSVTGKILLKHYDTLEKVAALIALGNMSILGPCSDKPEGHSFKNPVKGHTVYYGRDRGETGCESRVGAEFFSNPPYRQLYSYLFRDGQWWHARFDGELKLLKGSRKS